VVVVEVMVDGCGVEDRGVAGSRVVGLKWGNYEE